MKAPDNRAPHPQSDFTYECSADQVAITGFSGKGRVVIPATFDGSLRVTKISAEAFKNNTEITEVIIPEGVLSIGDKAFTKCSNVNSFTLPESLLQIGRLAFQDCLSLTSITLPRNLTSLGLMTFGGCTNLREINIDKASNVYGSENGVVFDKSKSEIVTCAQSIAAFHFPACISSIGKRAFVGCARITELKVPASVSVIGEGAFAGCTNLIDVLLPDHLQSIEAATFWGCSNLKSVRLPSALISIGERAFYECSQLAAVSLPNQLTAISDYAFYRCSCLSDLAFPGSLRSIGGNAFAWCSNLTSVELPSGLNSIGDSAFNSCTGMTTLRIPDSVTAIGDWAFGSCTNLKRVFIPEAVSKIGGCALHTSFKTTLLDLLSGTGETQRDRVTVQFRMTKGDGVIPDVSALPAAKKNNDYIRSCMKFVEDFWEVEEYIESWEMVDNGLGEMTINDHSLSGDPTPIIEFRLSKEVNPEKLLHGVWLSRYALEIPECGQSQPFYFEDHNGYSSVIHNPPGRSDNRSLRKRPEPAHPKAKAKSISKSKVRKSRPNKKPKSKKTPPQ